MKQLMTALALTAAITGAQAAILTSTDTTFGVFDRSSGTRTFTLGAGTVTDVNFSITLAKCDDPALDASGTSCVGGGTPYNSEIDLLLTNPFGTSVHLLLAGSQYSNGSGPGTGIQTLVFDDAAAALAGGNTLLGGTFKPYDLLAAFNGQGASGAWTLTVGDTNSSDPLMYFSSTLTVATRDVANQVSEPGSMALLGLGLAGLVARRRRTRA